MLPADHHPPPRRRSAPHTGLKPLPRRRYEDTLPAPTSDLQARAAPLDLDKNVGKTLIVEQVGRRGPGYYCDVCRKTCKDSIGYLDHINGRSREYHDKGRAEERLGWLIDIAARSLATLPHTDLLRLGQTTHVARSTPEAVRARIEMHRARLAASSTATTREYDFLARVEEIAKKEREEKERKREEKRERKRVRREEDEAVRRGGGGVGGGDGGEDEMMKMMGFGGFGSSKK